MFVMKNTSSLAVGSREVEISYDVIRVLYEYRQQNEEDLEACGVIIGSRLIDGKKFWLGLCTVPQELDARSRSAFTLKDPYHQDYVDQCYVDSGGELGYMGTWHSHPQLSPRPSSLDRKDWAACIERNPDRTLFFIIAGISSLGIFTKDNGVMLSRFFDFDEMMNGF